MNALPPRKDRLFNFGHVVATPGFIALIGENKTVAAKFLAMHVSGDWGLVDREDGEANDEAVRDGYRILSAYELNGTKFWIITEADRSVTTFLLPEEY